MANEQNLIPNQFKSGSEARENGRKGGIASGIAKRKAKSLQECAMRVLTAELQGADKAKLEKIVGKMDDDEATLYTAAVARQVAKAVQGDTRAFHEIQRLVEGMAPPAANDGADDPLSAALRELGGTL